jgi:PhzF family phenazine biosynthesis protein
MEREKSIKEIPVYQMDAFTDKKFGGNPAAVCLLGEIPNDTTLQSVASEMNLSETAFLYPLDHKPFNESGLFSLRWFTPEVEVPLCGHATLASAAVLFYEQGNPLEKLSFKTKSGLLTATREGEDIVLDFPANKPEPIVPPHKLLACMGINEFEDVALAVRAKKLLVRLKTEDEVRELEPDFEGMKISKDGEDILGVIATSKGQPPFDFISRFFAPWVGINEDPVTGAAHTVLTPYWSKITGRNVMTAYQTSKRGGQLTVRIKDTDRVELVGRAVLIMKGCLFL